MTQHCVLIASLSLLKTLLLPCVENRGWIRLLAHLTNKTTFQDCRMAQWESWQHPGSGNNGQGEGEGGQDRPLRSHYIWNSSGHLWRNGIPWPARGSRGQEAAEVVKSVDPQKTLYPPCKVTGRENSVHQNFYTHPAHTESAHGICFWSNWKAEVDEK